MTFHIIPAIDILEGRVVRLQQGDYDQVTPFDVSPVEIARQFEQAGADRIHLVDLDGAREGSLVNRSVFQAIRKAVNCELEIGGGIRSRHTIEQLLDIGFQYCILGSVLIQDPEQATELITHFPNRMIAGIDARNEMVSVSGWLETSGIHYIDLLSRLNQLPLAGVIFTDIATDGMMQGPNLGLMQSAANHSIHPVIASGGVRHLDDVHALKALAGQGLSGCIIGKAVLSGQLALTTLFH